MTFIGALVGAIPEGLVLLLGLGAAAWLFGRSRPAAIALGAGMVILAGYLLLDVIVPPATMFLLTGGGLGGGAATLLVSGGNLLIAAVHGAGILAVLVGVCLGPAPARPEEEY